MAKYLIVLMLCFFSIGLAQEEKKARPKRYTGVGLLDHKTGLSIFGNTWALYQTNQHEIFAGLGIMPAGTLSLAVSYTHLTLPTILLV